MKVGERGLTSERYLSFVTVTDDDANTDDLPRFDVKSSPYWRSLGFRHIVNDLVGIFNIMISSAHTGDESDT